MFPNPHSVYLHATPTQGLFAQAERTFSSGCVRAEKPLELATYLLGDAWSVDHIQTVLKASSAERTAPLPERVPVHLQYWPAWAEEDGTVHFRADIYSTSEMMPFSGR